MIDKLIIDKQTYIEIAENDFVKRLITAIDQHWMNGLALSDFRQIEIKLKLIDHTLDYDAIERTKKVSSKLICQKQLHTHYY